MFVEVHVRRFGHEFAAEMIAAAHIVRVAPLPPGEINDGGCRVTLTNQPVTLILRERADELRAKIYEATKLDHVAPPQDVNFTMLADKLAARHISGLPEPDPALDPGPSADYDALMKLRQMVEEYDDGVYTGTEKVMDRLRAFLKTVEETSPEPGDATGGEKGIGRVSSPQPSNIGKLQWDAMRWAEGIIRQLPKAHEGAQSWLKNHGTFTTEDILSQLRHGQWPGSACALTRDAGPDDVVGGESYMRETRRYVTSCKEYLHRARRTRYALIGEAQAQTVRPIMEGDSVCVYVSLDSMAADGNTMWVRPKGEFHDGRFVEVKHDK